jgi:hypothetical protein
LLFECLSVINFGLGGSDFPLPSVYSVHCVLLVYTKDSSLLEYETVSLGK